MTRSSQADPEPPPDECIQEHPDIPALRAAPEFFTLVVFFKSFKSVLKLPKVDASTLENGLVEPLKVLHLLEVICRLAEEGAATSRLNIQDWEAELAVACARHDGKCPRMMEWFPEGSPLQYSTWFDIAPLERLYVLALLAEWKLEESLDMRQAVEEMREAARVEEGFEGAGFGAEEWEVASDAAGRTFYHDGELNARVYREDRGPAARGEGGRAEGATRPRWSTLCTTVEEAMQVQARLNRSRQQCDRELIVALETLITPVLEMQRRAASAEVRREQQAQEAERAMLGESGRRSNRLDRVARQKEEKAKAEAMEEQLRREAHERRRAETEAALELQRLQWLVPQRLREHSECTTSWGKANPASVVGHRVRVYRPSEEEWYEGLIESYNPETRLHTARYKHDPHELEHLLLISHRVEWEPFTARSQPKLMDTAASKRKREELEALRQRTYNLTHGRRVEKFEDCIPWMERESLEEWGGAGPRARRAKCQRPLIVRLVRAFWPLGRQIVVAQPGATCARQEARLPSVEGKALPAFAAANHQLQSSRHYEDMEQPSDEEYARVDRDSYRECASGQASRLAPACTSTQRVLDKCTNGAQRGGLTHNQYAVDFGRDYKQTSGWRTQRNQRAHTNRAGRVGAVHRAPHAARRATPATKPAPRAHFKEEWRCTRGLSTSEANRDDICGTGAFTKDMTQHTQDYKGSRDDIETENTGSDATETESALESRSGGRDGTGQP